jgi:hypothetical protein
MIASDNALLFSYALWLLGRVVRYQPETRSSRFRPALAGK